MAGAKKRVAQLEAQAFAYQVILQQLARDVWRSDIARHVKRDAIRDSVAAILENGDLGKNGSGQLRQVLGEVEAVFQALPPLPEQGYRR